MTTQNDLPPLPEPVAHIYPSDLEKFQEGETFAHAYSIAVGCPDERSAPLHSEMQMREYGQLCRQQAMEEAAKLCRETALPGDSNPTQYRDGYIDGFNRGADQCERAIRSMK